MKGWTDPENLRQPKETMQRWGWWWWLWWRQWWLKGRREEAGGIAELAVRKKWGRI